jgi:hypothetical protein
MNALVSGQAGVVVLSDGDQLHSFTIDNPNELIPRRESDLRFLFGGATDVIELHETDSLQSHALLVRLWKQDRALHLALILLDPSAESPTRLSAASCLDEFLDVMEVEVFLANLLFAAPLPTDSDLPGAFSCANEAASARLISFLDRLQSLQPQVQTEGKREMGRGRRG